MHDIMRCVEGMLGLGVHVCHMRFRKKLCCAESLRAIQNAAWQTGRQVSPAAETEQIKS